MAAANERQALLQADEEEYGAAAATSDNAASRVSPPVDFSMSESLVEVPMYNLENNGPPVAVSSTPMKRGRPPASPDMLNVTWTKSPGSQHQKQHAAVVYEHSDKSTCRRVAEWCVVILVLVGSGAGLFFLTREYLGPTLRWHDSLDGWVNILVYLLVFFIVSLPMMFGYVIACVGAGYIYGVWIGLLLTVISTLLSAAVIFGASRSCLHERANKIAAGHANFHAVRQVLEEPGWTGLKMIAMLRLSPVPVGVSTMLLAVCDMTLSWQSLGTFIGMLPTQVLYCVIGSTLPSLDDVINGKFNPFVVGTEIVLMVVVTWYIGVTVRRSLKATATQYAHDTGMTALLGDGSDESYHLKRVSYHTIVHDDEVRLAYAKDCANDADLTIYMNPMSNGTTASRTASMDVSALKVPPTPSVFAPVGWNDSLSESPVRSPMRATSSYTPNTPDNHDTNNVTIYSSYEGL